MLDVLRPLVVFALLAPACSSPPPALPGDAGSTPPDGGSTPPPDAGPPLPLPNAEWSSLGPDAGGVVGPIAVTASAVVLVTRAGLYRSEDAGDTWTWMRPPAGCAVPTWIGARGDELFTHCEGVVSRSTDEGETWVGASEASDITPPFAVEGQELLATRGETIVQWNEGTWEALPPPGGAPHRIALLATDGTRGYALSTRFEAEIDLGAADTEWQQMTGLEGAGYATAQLAFAGGIAYAIVENGSEWIVLEREGSGSWTITERIPAAESPVSGVVDARVIDGTLYVAAANGLFVSGDGGATFTREIDAAFVAERSIARVGDALLAASADGLYRRTERGWNRLPFHPEPVTEVRAVGDGAIARRQGRSWTDSNVRTAGDGTWAEVGLPSAFSAPIVVGGEVFAVDGAVWASSDGGATFEQRSPAGEWMVFLDAAGDELITSSSTSGSPVRLLASRDGGRTWTERGAYPASFFVTPVHLVHAGSAWLLETLDGAVLRSDDDLGSWHEVVGARDHGGLRSLVVSGSVVIAARDHGGVARSDDGGASWELAGLDDLPVSAVAAHGGAWIAGIGAVDRPEGGVRISYDLGETWSELPIEPGATSLADARIASLSSDGDRILAGTFDRGVWRAELPAR